MIVKFKTKFKKGDLLPITVKNGKVILSSILTDNRLEINNLLDKDTLTALLHVGKGYAVVLSQEELSICYFAQFHVHSEFSILDGMSKLKDIAKKSSGITAVTDHGNMHNLIKWQTAMNKEGKKGIFGCEVYCESSKGEKNGNHLLLLAKDEEGKRNLFELSSSSYFNFYKKPHVRFEDLKQRSKGLICTSACLGGEIPSLLLQGKYDDAKAAAKIYKDIFGDDFYLELQRHGVHNETVAEIGLLKLAKELSIKVVAANDSHYINAEDAKYHEILLCTNQKKSLYEHHLTFEGTGYHYMTDYEMVKLFWDIPEAISNTLEIADKCNLQIETGVYHLPTYPLPEGYTSENEYLKLLIKQGFKERYEGTEAYTDPVYTERLEYETQIILSMGFSAYFLIVWDYVNWAKNNGILVGPGRGSAAGSLVAYSLKITDLDPIRYGLLFERFLNPDRISMPDIDMDFEDERRGEVIEYVKEKYGRENVCKIITFGSMQAKLCIQDVSRVMEVSDKEAKEAIGNLSIKEAAKTEAVKSLCEKDSDFNTVFQASIALEGNTRQTGVHACGVIVADSEIKNYMPTMITTDKETKEKVLVSQVSEVEDMGLLKMDFLGLKTMSVIGYALKGINKLRESLGMNTINYYREIPINDPYVYQEISKGESFAVFQIESEGMRSFMSDMFSDVQEKISRIENLYGFTGFGDFVRKKEHRKDSAETYEIYSAYITEMQTLGDELFERLVAGVSLYRPGPMDYIPDYIQGMKNPESITYDVPELKPILKNTYGVIVYQEQVMQIVRELAGFTMGQSDTIRKAMGKKKQEILDEYRPYFIRGSQDAVDDHTGKPLNIIGCTEKGIPEETAVAIWNKMNDFAKYAFNKSHAAVYAVLTATCAWLKFYYPSYYMTGVLNTYINNNEKLRGYISVANLMGLNILPADCNLSGEFFDTNGKEIRYGLKALNGFNKTASEVESERIANGHYKDFKDFIKRTLPKGVNKSAFLSLNHAGAFDSFKGSRKSRKENLDIIINKVKKDIKTIEKDKASGQISFFNEVLTDFDRADDTIYSNKEYSKKELLRLEKESCGMYISEHPLDSYKDFLSKSKVSQIAFLDESVGQTVTVAGVISDVAIKFTKKDGRPMAIVTAEDTSGAVKFVVFPDDYVSENSILTKNEVILIKGKVDNGDFGIQILSESVIKIEEATKIVHINALCINNLNYDEFIRLDSVLKDAKKGDVPVYFRTGQGEMYDSNYRINISSSIFMSLQDTFGRENLLTK